MTRPAATQDSFVLFEIIQTENNINRKPRKRDKYSNQLGFAYPALNNLVQNVDFFIFMTVVHFAENKNFKRMTEWIMKSSIKTDKHLMDITPSFPAFHYSVYEQ